MVLKDEPLTSSVAERSEGPAERKMGTILSGIATQLLPYLLAVVGFFGWKWQNDRKVVNAAREKDELRKANALARALAIERPTSSELRESLRRNTF